MITNTKSICCQYGRYFGYIIVVPKGTQITGVTIGYVESPDGVIYIAYVLGDLLEHVVYVRYIERVSI